MGYFTMFILLIVFFIVVSKLYRDDFERKMKASGEMRIKKDIETAVNIVRNTRNKSHRKLNIEDFYNVANNFILYVDSVPTKSLINFAKSGQLPNDMEQKLLFLLEDELVAYAIKTCYVLGVNRKEACNNYKLARSELNIFLIECLNYIETQMAIDTYDDLYTIESDNTRQCFDGKEIESIFD